MNTIALSIKNRLSLRPPQTQSLEILSEITDTLTLKKNADLEMELGKVRGAYPTCADFERAFPSMCFALATGVGKTRLMGAFIAYLVIAKGKKNFFVLAPNLTIYNKLIEDFSNRTSPKYVFQGIGEFVHNPPKIITGDNYLYASQSTDFFTDIHINVFNISKINAETRGDNVPRIKRLSEYLGDSYFNYLSALDDLVLLMDESHHYRADRGLEVINELNPILGLELTATPQVERNGSAVKFKNVVYEYSLAKAIRDGFVKEPAVATRKDFDPSKYSLDDLDRIKLEDGIRIHEDTKVALAIYARDTQTKRVKPFVLVVAKDTVHAGQLKELITSSSFFDGYYADKVMEIHSNQRGSERDENIAQLLTLESPDNKIEIVIHVNMLKEGWDVTNLYTIIPLRTAASVTLREQTIGRGLRLPYGKRTGVPKVDKLTIVSHDKFQEIIDEANKPDSIIRRENVIVIDEEDLNHPKEVVSTKSVFEKRFEQEEQRISGIEQPEEKQKAQVHLEVEKSILAVLPDLGKTVRNVNELKRDEIRKVAFENVKERIERAPQQLLFKDETLKEFETVYNEVVDVYARSIIEIPRIVIQPSGDIRHGFRDFDLDVKSLNFQPVSEEILRRTLRDQEDDIDIIGGRGRYRPDTADRIIVNELMNYSEIDYDAQADLLFTLARQAVSKLSGYLNEDDVMNVVQYNKREIGRYIYAQLMENFYYESPTFEHPIVQPFTQIKEHNYSQYKTDKIYNYTETVTPTNSIPSKLFNGFRKACHELYRFDSKTEKDFASILERDKDVLKWLRPAPNQFHIYWKHNSQQYRPDFIVETADTIYMIETKKEGDIETPEVQEKARAALEYCRNATEFTTRNGGKPWKYVLIPHHVVMGNMSFEYLVGAYESK